MLLMMVPQMMIHQFMVEQFPLLQKTTYTLRRNLVTTGGLEGS
ncbi:hypothetical protein D917_06234 [Trichinella nativa]|uniref:Uncharacterized protein n=1 Tax=Trichinella nativa TaxID=6335 RepID=A0A1Y3ET47_9BILA|nr:hypothetical protein D917_06234 [Trichinella nativa]